MISFILFILENFWTILAILFIWSLIIGVLQ